MYKNKISEMLGDDINESDLLELKSHIKKIEKKIKENNKPKTITISSRDHDKIKKYCTMYSLNIGDWVAKIALKEIGEISCVIVDDMSYEESEKMKMKEIEDNFNDNLNRKRYLIKSEKIIIHPQFKFCGYSTLDAKPIYEFIGDITHFKMTYNTDDIYNCIESEINLSIKYNLDLSDDIKVFEKHPKLNDPLDGKFTDPLVSIL